MEIDYLKLVDNVMTATANRAFYSGIGRASSLGHSEATVEHILAEILSDPQGEPATILAYCKQDRLSLLERVEAALRHAPAGATAQPLFSQNVLDWLAQSWLTASVEFGETALRSGMLLYEIARDPGRYLAFKVPELKAIATEELSKELIELLSTSSEAVESAPFAQRQPGEGPSPAGKGALDRFCKNFTEEAREGRIDPIFGRHREIRQTIDILCRRRKNNPMIVGEPGVGKSALVEGLALQIVEGSVPESLQNTEIYGLDLGLLQAGASVRGEFENRLKGVIQEVKEADSRIILFIDEAHTLIGAGGPQGGSDAANLLKPALARGELRTIAATTWSEFKKYFEKDAALERRFQPVKVEQPSEADACVMLRGLKGIYEEAHGVRILDEAVVAAVELSHRYLTGRQLPDKAVDLMDTASARVRVGLEARPEELVGLEEGAAALDRKLQALLRDQSHGYEGLDKEIEATREELSGVTKEKDQLFEKWRIEKDRVAELLARRQNGQSADSTSEPSSGLDDQDEALIHVDVTADAVARTVSAWTGIPLGKMKRSTLPVVAALEDRLLQRVKGQDHALGAVAEAVRASYAGIRSPDGPIGVMLFVGPSGVGKTETALALTDFLYGEDRFLTTINMTEFTEKHTVSRLIGSPPGYVGYGEGGLLTEAVRQRPYSVVLLDECEKADPQVMNLFYQVFDKGWLNDGEGRPINFRNTMILMTSNLATDTIMQLYASEEAPTSESVVDAIRPELSAHFKPALLGRMTIVPYRPIDAATMRTITELKLKKLAGLVHEAHGVQPTISDEVIDEITKRCTAVETGARNVDHILRGALTPVLAKELLTVMSKGGVVAGVDVSLAPEGTFRVKVSSE